ncbi:MAG: DUF4440 domain-containing protein [Gammaproteobacteria bacterium]|nr:MAG: DUF4440 domain-containing protein [Gammaproteobacteria bacterium]
MSGKKINMEKNSTEVTQVLEAYKSAVLEKNVDAFMQLYDVNARIFDTWGVWLFDKADSRLPNIKKWFEGLGDERVVVNFDDVRVTSRNDMAIVTAVGTYAAVSVSGVELRSMQNRFTWALEFSESGWKIIHEHTSVPIGDDLTAKLVRN